MSAKTIRTQAQLIEAAKAAGLKVTVCSMGHTTIVRNRNRAVRIHQDRVILDVTVDAAIARRMSVKDAAECLKLA